MALVLALPEHFVHRGRPLFEPPVSPHIHKQLEQLGLGVVLVLEHVCVFQSLGVAADLSNVGNI